MKDSYRRKVHIYVERGGKRVIDLQSGAVKVADDLCVHPHFTFEDFKKSGFYNNQNEIRVIYLDEIQVIDNRKYAVSLFFRDKRISVLSLLCCDEEYTHETEKERKIIHDMILRKLNIIGYKKFSWGQISSNYDPKGNISSICVEYY